MNLPLRDFPCVRLILALSIYPLAGWCNGNIPVSLSGAAGSTPAPAPIYEVTMNVFSCIAFFLGLVSGVVLFDVLSFVYYFC